MKEVLKTTRSFRKFMAEDAQHKTVPELKELAEEERRCENRSAVLERLAQFISNRVKEDTYNKIRIGE